MRRREFIAGLGGAVLGPLMAQAQQTNSIRRIGILIGDSASDSETQRRLATFVHRLDELGWKDGSNLSIEYRWGDGNADRIRANAVELMRLSPDAIFAVSTPALAAAKSATQSIPTVFVSVSDPVGLGFVSSLGRPGGNITGFSNFEPEMGGKWLELLMEVAPGRSSATLLFNPDTAPFNQTILRLIETAGKVRAVKVGVASVRSVGDIERAIADVGREPGAGLIIGPDTFTYVHRETIATVAISHRVPAVAPLRGFTASGGLMSYGVDLVEQSRQAAVYVDRILKGARPSDLPVQQPTKFELVINLKTAKAIGLAAPATLLARADEVIE
jgi:putative ABC transport system substrate-binding protein